MDRSRDETAVCDRRLRLLYGPLDSGNEDDLQVIRSFLYVLAFQLTTGFVPRSVHRMPELKKAAVWELITGLKEGLFAHPLP